MPDFLVEVATGNLSPAVAFGELEIVDARQVASGQCDDAHGVVQAGLAKQVIERRE
ncbi:hypothetical protein D3C80_2151740 [compost metagenome]